MRNDNFIAIQGWMVNELKLQGNELLCYALVYGFSQDGESCFKGNRKYIATLIGASSLNTVDKILKSLIDKELILKESKTINGIIFNSYKINNKHSFFTNCTPTSKNEHPHSNFEHNNYIDNNKKEIEDNKLSSTKNEEVKAFIDAMYALYPAKCPKRGTSLGKSSKDKDRIKKLLKTYKMHEIEKVIKYEIEEKYGKQYMQNFSTFLNNFPDPNSIFFSEVVVVDNTISKDGMVNEKGEVWCEQLQKWLK